MINSRQIALAVYKIAREEKKSNPENITNILLDFLVKNKLINLLPQIVYHLDSLAKKEVDFNTLNIETAEILDHDLLSKIYQKFHLPEMKKTNQNKDLLGGFVATYRGVVYDASLKNRIRLLRNKLIIN